MAASPTGTANASTTSPRIRASGCRSRWRRATTTMPIRSMASCAPSRRRRAGGPIGIYQVPRDEADLAKRVELMNHTSIVGLVSGVYMALMSVKDAVAKVNPQYAANIEAMYRHARDNDLRAAEVITDAKGDRKRKAHEQDDPDLYLRIVERRNDGIVVRGAKLHITGASLCHELVVMPTKGMRQDETDYAVSFSIPVNTTGREDHQPQLRAGRAQCLRLSGECASQHSRGFRRVRRRVRTLGPRVSSGRSPACKPVRPVARAMGAHRRRGRCRAVSQLYVGLAQLVLEHQGKERDPVAQNAVSELISFAELMRMSLDYACRHYERTPSGMIHPNVLAINVAKFHWASNYHAMVRHLHDVSGGLVITVPLEADLRNEESGKYLSKYLKSVPGAEPETRMRVYNLIRDLTADAYGGWQFVVALQAGGGLNAQRIMMHRTLPDGRRQGEGARGGGATHDS